MCAQIFTEIPTTNDKYFLAVFSSYYPAELLFYLLLFNGANSELFRLYKYIYVLENYKFD